MSKESIESSEFHEKPSWIETYWPVLLITFAVVCILCLDFCHPSY